MRKKTYDLKNNITEEDLKRDRRKPHKKEPKKFKVVRKKDVRDNMIINADGTVKISELFYGKPFTDKVPKEFLELLDKVKRKGNSSLPANLRIIMFTDSYPAGGGFIAYAIGIKEDIKRGKNDKGQGRLLSMVLAVDTKTEQACCFTYRMGFIKPFILGHFLCCDNEEDFDEDLKIFEDTLKEAKEIKKEKFKNKRNMDLRDLK